MVAWGLRLLIRAVVFFVDDDHTEVPHRSEQGRARPDGDPLLAGTKLTPGIPTLSVRQRRVQDRHLIAKPRPESLHGLRRQADFGHKHDRATTLVE